MKKTLKIIYVTLLFLAVFALGEYFAAKNIFNLFEDRVISKNLQGTTTSKILMEEPSVDLISEETYLYEVYKGTNDANNEDDILTLYTNNKYVLSVKSNDRESIRIGWFEQDENMVILHEKYYSNGDNRMFESNENFVLICYYTSEGSLNIKSVLDKRIIKMFKVADEEMIATAPIIDYSGFALIKETN